MIMNDLFSWSESPRPTAYPIAAPGYFFIGASAFITAVFALLGLTIPAVFFMLLTVFVCFFFRDPDRVTTTRKGAVVSPADGRVVMVETLERNPYFEGPALKISIFMSIFNVHVNRIPHEGKVTDIIYTPGKFFNASLDKASEDNERNAVMIETLDGMQYCTVQIAGLVARRIICRLQKGMPVKRGRRFGMICFGSRLELYLPPETLPNVAVGDNVRAGTSIVGYWQ
jgi:phosphatidylserine decarboxylase